MTIEIKLISKLSLLLALLALFNFSNALTTVHLKFFIEGYYDASTGMMRPVRMNQGCSAPNSSNECVLVTVSLYDNGSSYYQALESTTATLMIDGTCTATFTGTYTGSYYLVVNHESAIETWSAWPVSPAQWSANSPYDFSVVSSAAYGDNQQQVAPGVWAIYSGDITDDENVDGMDYVIMTLYMFTSGCDKYDLDGNGIVGLADIVIVFNNMQVGTYVVSP
jgi:hypothetical protein